VAVGFEALAKGLFNRQRPFRESREVILLQPLEPLDPSFPSGDALRIWYLVVITTALQGGSTAFWIAAGFLAAVVSLGRLFLGAHYPTDVLGGAGLGLIAGGTTIWLWQLLLLN
jgi:undecaprenyl-diphosphatase